MCCSKVGSVWSVVAVEVCCGWVRHGRFGLGGSGMLGSVKVGHGMAKYGGRGGVW